MTFIPRRLSFVDVLAESNLKPTVHRLSIIGSHDIADRHRPAQFLVHTFYRLSQRHEGTSSSPWPTIWVSPSCLSSSIDRQAEFSLSAAMRREACETTKIWVDFAATPISLASAGKRSGCKLDSGSFKTMRRGGRGVNIAAVHKR